MTIPISVMWTISKWQEKQKTWDRLGNFWWKTLIWKHQHRSWTTCIWDALNESAKRARILWIITNICSNPGSLLALWKNYQKLERQGNLTRTLSLHGPMIWKVMQKSAWKDIANWRTKLRSNDTKSRPHALDDHQFKEAETGSVEKLSTVCSNVQTWIVWVDLIFYGPRTNLLVRSQNGLKLVASDLSHSSHMWIQAILLSGKQQRNNADSDRFKILILQDSKSTSCGLVHFRKPNIRAKKLDVQETDFSFTQFYRSWNNFSRCRFTHGWNSRSRSWCFRDWSISFSTKPNQQSQRSWRVTAKPVAKNITQHAKPNSNHAHQSRYSQYWSRFIKHKTFWFQCYVLYVFCCGQCCNQRSEFPQSCKGYFDRINLDPQDQFGYIDTKQTNLQTFWPEAISHVTNGTIFFICSTSVISAPLVAQRKPAWLAAPKRWRRGCRNKKKKK